MSYDCHNGDKEYQGGGMFIFRTRNVAKIKRIVPSMA